MGAAHRLTSLALWGCVVLLVGLIASAGATAGQTLSQAHLTVVFPDGAVETRCVTFEEEQISGAELLRRAGLTVVFSSGGGFGAGVCRIGEVGCSDPGSCYCQCEGGDCAYWAYFGLNEDGAWRYQNVGPSQRQIRDGDSDAWVWGAGAGPPADLAAASCDGEDPPTPVEPAAAETASFPATDVPAPQAAPTNVEPGGTEPEDVATARPPVVSTAAFATPAGTQQVAAEADAQVATDTADVDAAVAESEDEDNAGAPVGLIAFGIVAAALVAGSAGVVVWRRAGG